MCAFKASIVKSDGLSTWTDPCNVIIASIFRKYPHLKLRNTGVCGECENQWAWADSALSLHVAVFNWACTFALSPGGATTLHFFKLLFTSSAIMASDARFNAFSFTFLFVDIVNAKFHDMPSLFIALVFLTVTNWLNRHERAMVTSCFPTNGH